MTADRSRPRRLTATLLAVLLLGALAGLAAPPAQAHNALRATTPADGAQVDLPPTEVTLEFDEPAIAAGTEIQVTGPDGESVDAGELTLTNSSVTQPISDALPAGAYRVLWRATSSDGHPISGEFAFTALAASAVPTATATPTATPTGGSTGSPTDTPAATPSQTSPTGSTTPSDDVAPDAASSDPSSGSSVPWLLAGVAVVAVLLVGGGLLASRRRDPNGPPGQS